MTGYVRKDTTNNIADGNVINAADLDSEFDGVQAAFNSSTGHTHDGSSAEGAPITKLGPVQDVTISTTVLGVKTTNTVDLGTSSLKFKDFYLAGNASIGGTLTYGGVTLSNAVTGTGSMVLSASPTITGTITAAAANFSGAVAFNGTTTIGDADTDTITQAASYVTGTQLKSAKTATNTLSLAAYDVDGTAYTNLITLTASNTPTLALTSTGVGTINNMSIGATTASTGAFTTLSATADSYFATSSGNVGIGTSSPTKRLDVRQAYTADTVVAQIGNTNNGNGSTPVATIFDFTEANGTAVSRISSIYTQSTGKTDLAFGTYNSGLSEKMRLDSSGNVGIGTSSPSAKLESASDGSATNALYLTDTRAYSSTPQSSIGFNFKYNAGGSYAVGSLIRGGKENATDANYAGTLSFWTRANGGNLTQQMTLDSSGNLGLGVTPSAWSLGKAIQVNGSAVFNDGSSSSYWMNNAYYNGGFKYFGSSGASSYAMRTDGAHQWFNAPSGTAGNAISFTQAMTLDASGNLGVGISSPLGKLDARGDVYAGANARILITENGTGDAVIGGRAGTTYLGFTVNGSEQARLTSTGLGIGTSSPAGIFNIKTSNGQFLVQNGTSANQMRISAFNNAGNANAALIFEGYTSEYGRFDSSGNLLVGDTTASGKLTVSDTSNTKQGLTVDVATYQASQFTNTTSSFYVTAFQTKSTSGNALFLTFGTEASFTERGSVTYNRGAGLTVYNTTSDYRAKTLNGPVQNALSKLALLKPSTGRMKDAEYDIDFFVAHELAEVVPSAVTGEKDAVNEEGAPKYQMVDKSALIPLLTAAIQEQQSIIQSLTDRITALEGAKA